MSGHNQGPSGPAPVSLEWMDIPAVCRRGMRSAIFGSCFKVLSSLSFANGLLLLFLTAMHLPGATVMLLLSLVNVVQALLLIPCAHVADRWGKRRMLLSGVTLCGVGFAVLPLAGLVAEPLIVPLFAVGTILYGAGLAGQVASWFAILSPLVPPTYRGRFFGTLRVSWQLCAVVLGAVIAFILPRETPVSWLVVALALVAGTIIPWWLYYARIPELERVTASSAGLPAVLRTIIHAPGYMPFCAYVFIINLFIGGCPMLFGLVEKRVLDLGDGRVVLLANLTMLASVAGYYVGGKAVDRIGTKPVFLVCHFGYGAALVFFVVRSLSPLPMVVTLGLVHMIFGFLMAAGSIAFASEMFALIPETSKSVSTSLCSTMICAGAALSGLLSAWGIRLGMFAEAWQLLGTPCSAYDAVLLCYGVMIVLMVVTLGLIPSVIGSKELRQCPAVT
jgi:MFS family permease